MKLNTVVRATQHWSWSIIDLLTLKEIFCMKVPYQNNVTQRVSKLCWCILSVNKALFIVF